jgi:hypothetical protein
MTPEPTCAPSPRQIPSFGKFMGERIRTSDLTASARHNHHSTRQFGGFVSFDVK